MPAAWSKGESVLQSSTRRPADRRLCGNLALDVQGQTAKRFESGCADLIILDGDAEVLLQCADEAHHRHRVELRNCAEQRCSRVHLLDAAVDLQRAAHDLLHLIEYHRVLLGCCKNRLSSWRTHSIASLLAPLRRSAQFLTRTHA